MISKEYTLLVNKQQFYEKEGTDFIMRKSIKALSALACAAAVAFTGVAVPTVTVKAETPTVQETLTDKANTAYSAIDVGSLSDQKFFTLAGGSTKIAWAPTAVDNIMKEDSKHAGVYTLTLKLPAYDEKNATLNEFKMCTIDNTVLSDGWDHALIAGTTFYGDNMSRFRVQCEKETEVTVYWDTTTGAVVVKDADGNDVDYMISFCGFDNELKWMTVDDMSASSFSDYAQDKAAIAQAAGCTAIPNLSKLNKDLDTKLASAGSDTVETTTVAAETTTAAAETTTAASQTTTTAQTSTKTGDAAPVAVVVTLCAAIAVVAFAAKKKEA